MSTRDIVLVQVDLGSGLKGLVNVDEIASMEQYTVDVGEDWTLITLKRSGKEISVHETISSLVGRIEAELGKPVVNR